MTTGVPAIRVYPSTWGMFIDASVTPARASRATPLSGHGPDAVEQLHPLPRMRFPCFSTLTGFAKTESGERAATTRSSSPAARASASETPGQRRRDIGHDRRNIDAQMAALPEKQRHDADSGRAGVRERTYGRRKIRRHGFEKGELERKLRRGDPNRRGDAMKRLGPPRIAGAVGQQERARSDPAISPCRLPVPRGI